MKTAELSVQGNAGAGVGAGANNAIGVTGGVWGSRRVEVSPTKPIQLGYITRATRTDMKPAAVNKPKDTTAKVVKNAYTFKDQDGVCTVPSSVRSFFDGSLTTWVCGHVHDEWYKRFQCNASSWGRFDQCQAGNAIALVTIPFAILADHVISENQPNVNPLIKDAIVKFKSSK